MRDPSDVEREIRELEEETHQAFLRGDAAWLESALAEGFVSTGPDGSVSTKAAYIAENTRDIAYAAIESEDLKVQVFGDTVVTLGRVHMQGTAGGTSFDATFGFTATYVRMDDRWQLVSEHVSLLEER